MKHSDMNEWLVDDGGQPQISLRGNRVFEQADRRHVAYVMKVRNPFFRDYACIVCAGLGPWGNSGAGWFFARHWRALSKRFGSNPFLVVLAITPGGDETAVEIAADGQETLWRRVRRWPRNWLRG